MTHGKANRIGPGEDTVLDVLADGEYVGAHNLADDTGSWDYTVKAITACTVLTLPRRTFEEAPGTQELRSHVQETLRNPPPAQLLR